MLNNKSNTELIFIGVTLAIILVLLKSGLKYFILGLNNGEEKWNKLKSTLGLVFVFIAGIFSGLFKIIFQPHKKKR